MKMETPKMDVVRFQEADVIVASPSPAPVIDTVTISGVGDTVADNNLLTYGNTSVNLQEAYKYHIQFGSGFINNGVSKTLAELAQEANDSGDSKNSDWNHVYNWNSSNDKFEFFDGQ